MSWRGARFALLCGAWTAVSGLAVAQEAGIQEADLPSMQVLQCQTACGKWTDPKPIGVHHGHFPSAEEHAAESHRSDAFVLIRFTITAEGKVENPVVERRVGPQDFADQSLEAVKDWRYEPATANGVPVARYNWYAKINYQSSSGQGARNTVYDACRTARELIGKGKYAEANAVLIPILSLERLNFYERSMVSLLLAVNDMGLKDYLSAQERIEDATIFDGWFLPKAAFVEAIRLQIQIDTMMRQYSDALDRFELLKKRTDITKGDHEAALIDKINVALADPSPILVIGRIPPVGYLSLWHHALLRRNFTFPRVDGKLERFELSCDQQKIESAITAKAEWHVPKNWSNCGLNVYGSPGATFVVAETND